MPARNPMEMMPVAAFWARAIGFLLLVVGTLMAVAFATPGGGCYVANADCGFGSSYLTGAANAFLAAKVLWTLGLLFLGAGAGIKMHWSLHPPASGRAEDVTYVVADRRLNGLLLLVVIVLLWFLLTSQLRVG